MPFRFGWQSVPFDWLDIGSACSLGGGCLAATPECTDNTDDGPIIVLSDRLSRSWRVRLPCPKAKCGNSPQMSFSGATRPNPADGWGEIDQPGKCQRNDDPTPQASCLCERQRGKMKRLLTTIFSTVQTASAPAQAPSASPVVLHAGAVYTEISTDGFRFGVSRGVGASADPRPNSGILVEGAPLRQVSLLRCTESKRDISASSATGGAVFIDAALLRDQCTLITNSAAQGHRWLRALRGGWPSV
jgi:hypothetical protein